VGCESPQALSLISLFVTGHSTFRSPFFMKRIPPKSDRASIIFVNLIGLLIFSLFHCLPSTQAFSSVDSQPCFFFWFFSPSTAEVLRRCFFVYASYSGNLFPNFPSSKIEILFLVRSFHVFFRPIVFQPPLFLSSKRSFRFPAHNRRSGSSGERLPL